MNCYTPTFIKKYSWFYLLMLTGAIGFSQEGKQEEPQPYKKKVLESIEIEFLSSYYIQDGENAAVSGGIGDEHLTDIAPTVVVSVPLNPDDVLTIEAGISAYSSASSSNVDPFDGPNPANPFQASSGASSADVWAGINTNYSHSSTDRNKIWTAKLSAATEYDYFSMGFGGSYTRLFNNKNTEISLNTTIFLDTWGLIYPIELRDFNSGEDDFNINNFKITGNPNYNPQFTEFKDKKRNSYALGASFSQILSKRTQALFSIDVVRQEGLLSMPFQRVYFRDVSDSFIEEFHLADDVERLPETRSKLVLGANINYYLNDFLVVRTHYRFYTDDWGIDSHTAKIELPVKVGHGFALYPSYRYYIQSQADYFAGYNEHLSSERFYTSDYDLSEFSANQYGLGVNYTDIFTKLHIWEFGMKSIDLEYNKYDRNSSFSANIIAISFKFVQD